MDLKRVAGEKAAEFVEDGMVVGLGTGSTVYWTLQRLGERVQAGLRIRGVPTSKHTEQIAIALGIPLAGFDELAELDLTIDGADEIGPDFALIKGGGGALLREKLVALASRRFVVVAAESKQVGWLGAFPLPVEVVPFAWQTTARRIARIGSSRAGCDVRRREEDGRPFVTDNGNFILDCDYGRIDAPGDLARALKATPGVVEHGLFVDMADAVVLGTPDGPRVIQVDRG